MFMSVSFVGALDKHLFVKVPDRDDHRGMRIAPIDPCFAVCDLTVDPPPPAARLAQANGYQPCAHGRPIPALPFTDAD
jgi:hypothetical protein